MRDFMGSKVAYAALMASVAAITTPAMAQESGAKDNGIQDIVVTATKQATQLSKVPISITAFDAKTMDQQSVRKVDDIIRLTPGITLNRRSAIAGTNADIAIRGITSTIGAPTTGVYINDTPIMTRLVGNTASNAYPLVFDLDRVEVLRGPQGTLFGASSEGGAVRFITPKPSLDKTSIYARGELSAITNGSMNGEAGLAVGMPIIKDVLGLRASAWYRHDGGWIDRAAPLTATGPTYSNLQHNVNKQDAQAYRVALGWEAAPGLTITPSLFYQRQAVADSSLFYATYSNPASQNYVTVNQIPTNLRDRFVLPALNVNWNLGGVELVSSTTYFDRHFTTNSDYTYLDAELNSSLKPYVSVDGQYSLATFINNQKTFSQELRLQSKGDQRLSWVVGGFYARSSQYQNQVIYEPYFAQLYFARTGKTIASRYGVDLLPGNIYFLTDINTVDTQYSGFAEASYKITDNLKFTAGARFQHVSYNANILRDGPLAGGRSLVNSTQSENPVTPKFNLSWQVDPSLLAYATAAKGFRPGGAQAQLSTTACATDLTATGQTSTPSTFKSDSLWSYEGGVKKRAGRFLSIDASGYVIKWKNIQQSVFFPSCGGTYVANTGSVTSRGGDLSVAVHPAKGVSLGGTMGYTIASYDNDVYSTPTSLLKAKGSRLAISPFSLTLFGEVTIPVGEKEIYWRTDYQHAATSPLANSRDYGFLVKNQPYPMIDNVDVHLGLRKGPLDVALFAQNLLNYAPVQITQSASTDVLFAGLAARPRVVGITATFRH